MKTRASEDPARDRDGLVSAALSAVIVERESTAPLRYIAEWYDYSGKEYAHVTPEWIGARLAELTGVREWSVCISDHGNGHRSMMAAPRVPA